jgi:hypothetical protein
MANDKYLRFADDDSIAANAAAEVDPVGDVLDLWGAATSPRTTFWPDDTATTNDIGDNDLVWETMVTTAMAGNGAVVTLTIYNHTAATSVNSGHVIAQETITVGASGIAVGNFLTKMGLPAGRITKRYLALHCAVATANLTAGSVDSSLTNLKDQNAAHGQVATLS